MLKRRARLKAKVLADVRAADKTLKTERDEDSWGNMREREMGSRVTC